MDPIETGPGEVAADEDDLAQVRKQKAAAGILGGAVRALGRKVEGLVVSIRDLGDSLRGRIARGEDRIAELERIVAAHGPRLSAVVSRTEGIPQLRREVSELGAEVLRIADEIRARIGGLELEVFPVLRGGAVRDSGGGSHRFPAFVRYTPEPGLVTPGLTPERVYRVLGRDTRFLRLEGDDGKPVAIAPPFLVAVPGPASTADLDHRDRFLEPPPIARAIGKAIAQASAEVKAEAAATLGARLSNILRTMPESTSKAWDDLTDAIVDARRAGVIP